MLNDTIFALSSGAPPAALAIIRVSGPEAGAALVALSGSLPKPRVASLRVLRDGDGAALDQAVVIWFPGPRTATGEDLAEFHLHGGRAVVAAVKRRLEDLPGLRHAIAGEFTRRAFSNGRIDLAEAEGLADLLSAETELQRRQAMTSAGGALSRQVTGWRVTVLSLSANLEATLDFGDEDDVGDLPVEFSSKISSLHREIAVALAAPRAEVLREGFRVLLAGPPNAGKSSLFNALVDDDAAITAPVAGTTRDVLTRPVALAGIPFLFVDSAGLRDEAVDRIEAIGIERARKELTQADLILWLGPEGQQRLDNLWEIESFADDPSRVRKRQPRFRVSALSGEGIFALRKGLIDKAADAIPKPGAAALNSRQAMHLAKAADALVESIAERDPLIVAELLRNARVSFDRLLGRAGTEDMLDTLFGQFCIGK